MNPPLSAEKKRAVRDAFDRPFEKAARALLRRGVHPNHFTFLQLPVFGLEIYAALSGNAWLFALLIVFVIMLDGGDGILARVGNLQSKVGAVLDATFDMLGIGIVMWGATRFFPAYEGYFMALFLANTFLFLQNALLGHKVVAYLRGPILIAVVFPDTLWGGLAIPTFVLAYLIIQRLPASLRMFWALGQPSR